MSSDIRSFLEASIDPVVDPESVNPHRKAARSTLEGCWTPLRGAIVPKMADVLLETFGPLSRSVKADEKRLARSVLGRDQKFIQEFALALEQEFKTAVRDFVEHKAAVTEAAAGPKAWSLVEFGEMEFSTIIESGSGRIRYAMDDVYLSVKRRLAKLVKELEIRDVENPFRPAMLLRAAHAALKTVEVTQEESLLLLKRFEATLVAPMAQAYAALDAHLEAQGMSDEPERPAIARGTREGAGGMHFAGGATADTMLRALYERLSVGAAPMVNQLPQFQAQPLQPPVAGAVAPVSNSEAPPMLGMPTMPMPLVGINPQAGLIDAGLLSAINEIQKLGTRALDALQHGLPTPAPVAEPAQLRQDLVEKAPKQVDKLTIEIVGLLFDRVNRDPYVPPAIKELIQQLQFPLIKVALLDTELFVTNEHPARRLIDRIASTAIGWTAEGEENARYFEAVRLAVHTVLEAVDAEVIGAFERALNVFEDYLGSERTRDDDPVTRAKRALAEAEDREIMVINATIQVRRAFDNVQLESYLREFLLNIWTRVLVAVALREKHSAEKHAGVKTYLSIIPDLVWSVQPKLNPEERKRLVGTIPPVLNVLRKGLMLIEWPKEEIQLFFQRLMNSHAQAVKALEVAQSMTTPMFEASTLRIKLDGIDLSSTELDSAAQPSDLQVNDEAARRLLQERGAEVEHIPAPVVAVDSAADAAAESVAVDAQAASAPETPTAPAVDPVRAAQILDAMKRGQWFALERDGAHEQVQLRWVSPHKTFYLFTSAQSHKAHSLSPQAITALLSAGHMSPVEAEPLFDRAVRDVLHDLRSASEAEHTSTPVAPVSA